MNEPAKPERALRPRDAATLILVERPERGAARVLMGKRHAGHRFMPGKFVFPGGRVEAEDRRMSAAGALDAPVEEKLNARVRRPSPGFARALALAAIRETFEETGLAIGVADRGARNTAARRLDPVRGDGRPSGARRHRLPRSRDHPARPHTALRRPLSHRRRPLHCRPRRRRRSSEAELVELVWTPLDEARKLDLPGITHAALDDLAQALDSGLDKRRPRPFYRELRGKRLREQL